MKVFVVFFCMVIGCTCLDLQRAEDGDDDLKSNYNERKAPSLAANGTINEDQYNRPKNRTVPGQSIVTSSSEIEASHKLQSVETPVTMTSDVKRSGQSVYVGRRLKDIWLVFKSFHTHISDRKYSVEGRRNVPETSTPIRGIDKDFAIHRRRSSRTKRWSKDTRLVSVRSLFIDYDFRGLKELWDESMKKEMELVGSLAKSGTVSTDVLNEYKAAKTAERKFLHHALNTRDMKIFDVLRRNDIEIYEFLSNDPQRYDEYELHKTYGAFLDKPSPARDRYKAMKDKEWATAQSYFDAPEGPDIYEGQTENEFEGLPPVDNDAKPDFECPRKKRESGSVSPKVNAQVFLILICVVIGILIPGLQVLEIDEEDPNANKNTMTVKRFVPGADRNRVCVRARE